MKRYISTIMVAMIMFLFSGCIGHLLTPVEPDSEAAKAVATKEAFINKDGESTYEKALDKYFTALGELDIDTLDKLSPYTGTIPFASFGYISTEELKQQLASLKDSGYVCKIKNYDITDSYYASADLVATVNEGENLKGIVDEVMYIDVKITTLYKPSHDYDTEEETSIHVVKLYKIGDRWFVDSLEMQ